MCIDEDIPTEVVAAMCDANDSFLLEERHFTPAVDGENVEGQIQLLVPVHVVASACQRNLDRIEDRLRQFLVVEIARGLKGNLLLRRDRGGLYWSGSGRKTA